MIDKKIIKAFFAPLIVLAVHVIFIQTGTYSFYDWLDIPMHLAGGFAIAIMIYSLLNIAENKKMLKITNLFRFLFVLSFVALISILWEFYEFAWDYLNNAIQNQEMRFTDTIKDFFFD